MQALYRDTAQGFLVLIIGSLFATVTLGISVWPLPSYYSSGNGVLWIAESVQFTYTIANNIVTRLFFPNVRIFDADDFSQPEEQCHLW